MPEKYTRTDRVVVVSSRSDTFTVLWSFDLRAYYTVFLLRVGAFEFESREAGIESEVDAICNAYVVLGSKHIR
jgi:hypothetical protein